MGKHLLYFVIIGLTIFSCYQMNPATPSPIPPQNPHLQSFVKNYIQVFDSILINTRTPGAGLVIIKDTTILHLQGHGVKSVLSEEAVDKNTVFRIASLSKGFASVLAGILVQKGVIKWTDKANHYLPEFVLKDSLQSNRINLIHLLSQTTGLPYHAYTNLVEEGITISAITKEFRKVNLIAKEGEIYAYQNAAYSLIGDITEEVLKKKLPEIYEEELFIPLQAENISTNYESIKNGKNVAQPHSGQSPNWRPRPISKKYYNAIPAGGVNASISDMGLWLQLLLGNRPAIISKRTLAQIYLPRVNTNNRNRYFHDWPMIEDAYYGLGWRILTNPQDTFIYHGGFVNGYRGEILINQKDKLGICVLVNAPSELAEQAVPLFLEQYALKRDSILAWDEKR